MEGLEEMIILEKKKSLCDLGGAAALRHRMFVMCVVF
jgi:hypothetical protein